MVLGQRLYGLLRENTFQNAPLKTAKAFILDTFGPSTREAKSLGVYLGQCCSNIIFRKLSFRPL